uniref:Uncharacterized protein n=1 Tax=Anguilla anguilla TaxID=7936 RepID=A0A0E9UUT5_ANGAN
MEYPAPWQKHIVVTTVLFSSSCACDNTGSVGWAEK